MFVERRRREITGGRDVAARSAVARSAAAHSGALRGACCDDCAELGDGELPTVQQRLRSDWVAMLSLGLSVLSAGALVFGLDRRRRSMRR